MMLVGTSVRIEQGFPIGKAALLWSWLNTPRSPNFDDYGPQTEEVFRVDLERRISTEKTWAIYEGPVLIGFAGFAPSSPVTGMFHGFVISPSHRNAGAGTVALSGVIADLVAQGFEKLIAPMFADNLPVWKLFVRCGFNEEGYFSGYTRRDRQPVDLRIMTLGVNDAVWN